MAADYKAVADRVAADIAAGRLRAGERLLPQREFAYRHGIAVSTASRVYGELARRGLVAGEVGRGTFVRGCPGPIHLPLIEPTSAPVDLELIFSVRSEHAAILAHGLGDLIHSPAFADALRPIGAAATPAARETTAAFLRRRGWSPDPDQVLFAGNGRQAIAAAFAATAKPGGRVGVEAMTYPVVNGIAARLGITLVPLGMDERGLLPDALAAAHRAQPLSAVYLQPSLHNPTGATMDEARRAAIAEVLRASDLVAVEDGVYTFLVDDEPLAALAPDRVIHIDSLSKRITPGLTLGTLAAPHALVARLAEALRTGAWSAAGLPIAAGMHWMAGDDTRRIVESKRADARARQALAREVLRGFELKGDPRAYHLWLPLPESWRGEAFAAAALRHGIAVIPGSAFAVVPGHAPNGVRLALASPEPPVLVRALQVLRSLANGEIRSGYAE